MERRTFIIAAVAGGVGLLEYRFISSHLEALGTPPQISVKAYEKYGERAALVAITPNQDFYLTSKGSTPKVDRARWKLTVDGLVEHPFVLTYEQLTAQPRVEKVMTLECISDPVDGGTAIGNARWTGTPLKPLIERARPAGTATHAVIYAADGFSTGHPLSRLWNEENFLAYGMNDEDLPPRHGYPVRIFIPGKFGMKQPKWVTRIQLVDHAYLGYWERQGWSNTCERWAHARFTDLADGAKISGRNFELTGYAVGNLDGIRAVEISFDDGHTWRQTNLLSNPSPITWSFWKYLWIAPQPGTYPLRVRAIDGKGRVQARGPQSSFPDGATGQQVLKVTVVAA